jgi:hypothetical protein
LHNLRRRVPDTQLLAQFRVEGFEERFVEILDGVVFNESREEFLPDDAVERCSNSALIIGTWSVQAADFQSKASLRCGFSLCQRTQAENTP